MYDSPAAIALTFVFFFALIPVGQLTLALGVVGSSRRPHPLDVALVLLGGASFLVGALGLLGSAVYLVARALA